MTEILVVALIVAVTSLAFVAGWLWERTRRLTELHTLLAQVHLEKRAYINQLLIKQGQTPIFGKAGEIVALEHVPDNVPVTTILRPPFAQAEYDWEEEEEANKPMTRANAFGTFVPDLTEEEKRILSEKYLAPNSP